MSGDRRHSLDIPVSKGLHVLRRVRSLRDPPTRAGSTESATRDKDGVSRIKTSSAADNIGEKFRPRSLGELVGQDEAMVCLTGAVEDEGKVSTFYVFHGPSGTGKTLAARIFAAALNCQEEVGKPCGHCRDCVLFYSGRCREFKEIDSAMIDRDNNKLGSLLEDAASPPVSSKYKVFLIDDCHLLQNRTWFALFLGDAGPRVVFIMVVCTGENELLPELVLKSSCCRVCYFQKIKRMDISCRLRSICAEEKLEFDEEALDFIASTSQGSLREAETALDQLRFIGGRITLTMARDLVGTVSDDELLDLLEKALSSDTSYTVRKARELMSSRIVPMRLVTQLVHLIVEILSGSCEEGASEIRKSFSDRRNSEADLQKLGHALKVLLDTEKNLEMTPSRQSTWTAAALLQLGGGSFSDGGDRISDPVAVDGSFCGSPRRSYSRHMLQSIWEEATTGLLIEEEGKLESIHVSEEGTAVAEVRLRHFPDTNVREEIASSLASVLRCTHVELTIKIARRRRVMSSWCSAAGLMSCYRPPPSKTTAFRPLCCRRSDCREGGKII